ncbi:MAG: hypothetical protein Tsb0020_22950 [Haliangiales bacterium]
MSKLIDPHGEPATPAKLDSDSLVAQLYDELRKLARIRIAQLRPGRTLEPTELVHELYQKLAKQPHKLWENQAQFYRTAAKAMHNILIDYDRARNAQRRGRDYQRVDISITIADDKPPMPLSEWFELYQAIEQMFEQYPQHAELVLFRYFAGYSMEELASLQEVHLSTINRRWRFARAWLGAKLKLAPTSEPDKTVPDLGTLRSNLAVTSLQYKPAATGPQRDPCEPADKTLRQSQSRAQQDDNVATCVEINEHL